jgi:hypothetical protein
MHWVGAVINFKRKRIEYFDSMGVGHGAEQVYEVNTQSVSPDQDRYTDFQNLREYIEAEHQDKKGSNYDMSDWKYVSKAVSLRDHALYHKINWLMFRTRLDRIMDPTVGSSPARPWSW